MRADGEVELEVRVRISGNSSHALIGHGVIDRLNELDLEGTIGAGAPAMIRPAVVEVETGLQSAIGRLLLTNAITLTPGTLSIDVTGNRITVHWIDCPPGCDMDAQTHAIVSDFERHLKGFVR